MTTTAAAALPSDRAESLGNADVLADQAVASLLAEADLTPKPGLVDRRGGGAHTDMDLDLLCRSARALHPAFAQCAEAAVRTPIGVPLRERIGEIGRAGEDAMLAATGGVNTHRGALWALGLLCAGAALNRGPVRAVGAAARLARLPDARAGIDVVPSHGALARSRYGAGGARDEAALGFPHVRKYGLPALWRARRQGADDTTARLDALLALMGTVGDTCVLHRGGPTALAAVRTGARAAYTAGGLRSPAGRSALSALDRLCVDRRLSPGGSGDLLAATLFLDALIQRSTGRCKR